MKTLLLICALGVSHGDCSVDTAEVVVQGPESRSLVICGMHGQAYLAEGALAGYLDGDHYLKITCTPDDRSRTARPLHQTAMPVEPRAFGVP
jgi:hypothetical protein